MKLVSRRGVALALIAPACALAACAPRTPASRPTTPPARTAPPAPVAVTPLPAPPVVEPPAPPPPPAPELVVINAVGDIAYPNGWGGVDEIDAKQATLFDPVRPILDTGDLNFANIECPMTTIVPAVEKTYPISCDPKRLAYVVGAGFNMLSLANNHSLDAGQQGLLDTIALVEQTSAATPERPLFHAGTGATAADAAAPTRFVVPGKQTRVAFFAVANTGRTSTVASMWSDALPAAITAAARDADIVLVSVHAGREYHHAPESDLVTLYHSFIDAGADAVLAHHPHVVQGVERYRDGVIFYSLGNFSFGSRTVRHHETGARLYSMIGRLTFTDGVLTATEVVPLYANNSEKWRIGTETLSPVHASPQRLSGAFFTAALDEFQDFASAVPGAQPTRLTARGELAVVEPSAEKIAMKNPDAVKIKGGGLIKHDHKPGKRGKAAKHDGKPGARVKARAKGDAKARTR